MTGMHLKNAWKGGNPALEAPVVEVQEGARSTICHALRGCRTICGHHFESTKTRELKGKEKSWQEEPGELEEQWWCGLRRGEERGGVKSGGSSTIFQESSSHYS